MSSQRSSHGNHRRRQEHIPEEKYDVDGTLIRNDAAFRKKRWDLQEIVNDTAKYREAMKEAQQYIKKQKEQEAPAIFAAESSRPWTEESDDLFFSRRKRGLASWLIPTGSPIYYEFEGMHKFHLGKVRMRC
jgi:beta-phosphoglucomutase-like phosphatase (HAD superfamily)